MSLLAAILDDADADAKAPLSSATTEAEAAGGHQSRHHLFDHFRRTSHSLATSIFYGFRIQDPSDPRLLQMYQNLQHFSDLSGGAQASAAALLLDVYPVLRRPWFQQWLPIYKHAVAVGEKTSEFFWGLWMPAKQKVLLSNGKMSHSQQQPCFAVSMVKAQQQEEQEQGQGQGKGTGIITDEEAAFIIGNAGLEAGSDTMSSTLAAFIMGVVMYPEVGKRLQECVDEFTSTDGPGSSSTCRMPTIEDVQDPRAQYVRACVKEALRWMPTGILGLPHAVVRDDEYRGYKILKDSSVVLNIW